MSHLRDEDLIRHYYGDGPAEAEAAVDDHLRACSECRASWDEMVATLKMVDAAAVPEPDAGFEARLWARVEAVLPQPNRTATGWHGPAGLRTRQAPFFALAAASLALVVTAGVLSIREWRPSSEPDRPAGRSAVDSHGRERVLLTGLDDHFQRSEILLVEVLNGPAAGGDELGFERQTADDLVDWGRLYRVAAQQNGNVQVAQTLEDLESVMVEIARSPEQMDRDELRSLRSRIQDDNLLFKVRAVSQQIQDRRKDLSTQ